MSVVRRSTLMMDDDDVNTWGGRRRKGGVRGKEGRGVQDLEGRRRGDVGGSSPTHIPPPPVCLTHLHLCGVTSPACGPPYNTSKSSWRHRENPASIRMQQLLLLQLLAASTVLGATLEHSQRIARNVNVEWPKAGLEVCEELQDERYSLSCQQCFHNSGKDFKKSLLEEPDHDCFDRFKVDENNKNWHLHSSGSSGEGKQRTSRDFDHTANSHHPKASLTASINPPSASPAQAAAERDMVYEYGNTGHDMPFEGVGPLAVDVLMGECIVAYLEGKGKLQILVDEILESPAPVPAWIFQELLTLIKTIKLT
ncbi:hypothetical protein Hamer_G022353 [Homarus americanus]|uniref:Uncharacterized protein n=1 Tax=Homarus americanus TaxID=6706 RepID=A0A8J5MKZ1_HOMAM|nr:hypothetical protein Hamer_G022353 [Homarus americanus]